MRGGVRYRRTLPFIFAFFCRTKEASFHGQTNPYLDRHPDTVLSGLGTASTFRPRFKRFSVGGRPLVNSSRNKSLMDLYVAVLGSSLQPVTAGDASQIAPGPFLRLSAFKMVTFATDD